MMDLWLCEGAREKVPFDCSGEAEPNIFVMPILSIDKPFLCRPFEDPEPVEPVLLPF